MLAKHQVMREEQSLGIPDLGVEQGCHTESRAEERQRTPSVPWVSAAAENAASGTIRSLHDIKEVWQLYLPIKISSSCSKLSAQCCCCSADVWLLQHDSAEDVEMSGGCRSGRISRYRLSATVPQIMNNRTNPSVSVSVSTSDGAKQDRRILACLPCQRRKIKCDRKFPCDRCLKTGVQCTRPSLTTRERRRRFPERHLLERIRHYEDLLRQNEIRFEPLHPHSSHETDPRSPSASKTKMGINSGPTFVDEPK
ncbi:hypothetical protein ANO11243_003610 [Dothideomycetidae sp. 11243]|nr:hypothetical protein ANO11243_003610 [fungal sp. No.11243]